MRAELLRFNGVVGRDPAIEEWMNQQNGELGAVARDWFEVMRKCGDEVREVLHDGCPVACLKRAQCWKGCSKNTVGASRANAPACTCR